MNNRYIVVGNGERHASYNFQLGEDKAYKYALLTAKFIGGEIIEERNGVFTKVFPRESRK